MSNSSFGAHSGLGSGLDEILIPAITNTEISSSPLAGRLANNLNQQGNHLVVIDSAVDNIEQLIAGIDSARVVVLDSDRNGIEQISEVLAEYVRVPGESDQTAPGTDDLTGEPLDSLHVVSHGEQGQVQLGNTTLDTEAIALYETEISGWGEAISSEGDILFYGCNLAVGTAGLQFVDRLSQLTGADVAASDDLTGAGGDWDLEVTTGSIEAQAILDSVTQTSYLGTLASYNGNEYVLTDGPKTWEIAQAEARNIGGNLVTINDAAEEAWLKETFGTDEGFWIGLSDRVNEGQFTWANGDAVTYTNWFPGEPNDAGGAQDYARMNFLGSKQWDDAGSGSFFTGIIEIEPVPVSGEKTYNGSTYVLTGEKSWEAAQAEAEAKGGNLVTINNAAEEAWIQENFGTNRDFWIGFNDIETEGQFEWASGEAVTYTNWAPGEPNNGAGFGEQDYGRMNFGANNEWDDHFANISLQGLIEIKGDVPPDPEPPIPEPPNPEPPDPEPPTTNPGNISIKTNLINIGENAGSARINIVRTGGRDGDLTVDYRTFDESAEVGEDYEETTGSVVFFNGEIQKSVSIPIINDDESESNERFNFTIDNVQGGAGLAAPRTAQITIVDDDGEPPIPKSFGGNQYVLTNGSKSWEEAQVEAAEKGGNLVTINSAEEEAWLQANYGINEDYWIGLNDVATEGQFEWVSGQDLNYTNWAAGEPNNGAGFGEQDFVRMNFGSTNEWDDYTNTLTLRGVIEIGGDNTPDDNPNPSNPPNPPNPTGEPTATTVYSGLNRPVAIEWTPDSSKMFIAEKGGAVKVAEDGNVLPTDFINIADQVNTANDRGLLDIAIHPNFPSTPYVYLLYSYDPPEAAGNSGLAGRDGGGNRAGRLTRVTADASNDYRTAVSGSEVVLVGKNSTWENFNGFVDSTVNFDEPPAGILPGGGNLQDFMAADSNSHSIGSIEFGSDGLLYASNGDGTSYNRPDPRTKRVQDVDNLSGKILRIDPITGQGVSSNPFYNGNPDSNQSKVYQLGLRNPFRFVMSPTTGQPVIGDVGWKTWEEINTGGAGANFGWPYFEGENQTGEYNTLPSAIEFYASNPDVTDPSLSLNHSTGINAIIMGDVYDGNTYPDKYDGDVFFNDVGRGIVSHANIDGAGNITGAEEFIRDSVFVVQMRTGPDGDLYYVDLNDGEVGKWEFA